MRVPLFLQRVLVIIAITVAVTAPAAAQDGPASCTVAGQNLYVRDVMTDIYYWYQSIPLTNPVRFNSPEAYLEAIRYRPLDSTFSYITSRAADEAFFSNSQFIGFGLSTQLAGAGDVRVSSVFADSPAAEAGLARGDRFLEIGGRTVADIVAAGELGSAFGPAEEGVTIEVAFVRGDLQYRARMVKRLVTIPTVSLTRIYEVDGRRVGYLFFRNFVQPSFAALDAAFAELRAGGATELVLDLRYNGGGLVSVAQHLASLIGGVRTEGQLFAEYFHNDRNAFRNHALRFENKTNALGLSRLVVIATRASASASELVINALRPFIPVVVIGDRTFGKPVGQYGIPFCDKVLAPVSFTLRNADGEGDFFEGFAPACVAADDLDRQIGDPLEASLREALAMVATGRCSTPQTAQPMRQTHTPRVQMSGWQTLVGAH
jgi:C-terminal processing protease CtpA/Prc